MGLFPDTSNGLAPVSDKINFNFSLVDESRQKEFAAEVETLNTRIEGLMDKTVLCGQPIVKMLLNFMEGASSQAGQPIDWDELYRLGLVLERLAPLMQKMADLQKKYDGINWVRENPKFLAYVFGDFDGDIEKLLATTSNEEPTT